PILAWQGKIMEHHSVLLVSVAPGVPLCHRAMVLLSKTKYGINHVRCIIDLNSAHIGCEIICSTTETVGVELL
ncbi:hypothetical protein A2U01_0092363, partial [Trifolium medium]|nr:hypothetical protein [Trifolium medium]